MTTDDILTIIADEQSRSYERRIADVAEVRLQRRRSP